jgi:hypothetical protein
VVPDSLRPEPSLRDPSRLGSPARDKSEPPVTGVPQATEETVCQRLDRIDETEIKRLVENLNEAIRAAQHRGLRVSLGIASFSGDPGRAEVRLTQLERPLDWRRESQ